MPTIRTLWAKWWTSWGEAGDNDVEMNTILAQYGLPYKYPKRVEDAAEKISAEITAQDYAEREDFRDVWTCTIDPRDAKDFDDALLSEVREWTVGVVYISLTCRIMSRKEILSTVKPNSVQRQFIS